MMKPTALAFSLPLLALLAACSDKKHDRLDVTLIGDKLAVADPVTTSLNDSQSVLLSATAQGLIRFDATGQIQAGLASRWAVVDEGRSLIFRLTDGDEDSARPTWLTAEAIADRLRKALLNNSRNRLSPQFDAVESIRAVTPQVIEIRLKSARPDVLNMLAQPEAALLFKRSTVGTGPLKITRREITGWQLSPVRLDGVVVPEDTDRYQPAMTLRAESAPRAVTRFARGWTQLVLGGRLTDWPLIAAARINARQVQIDPANGLYGLAIGNKEALLQEPSIRRALAMALDRNGLLRAMDLPTDLAQDSLLPQHLHDLSLVPPPPWSNLSQNERQAFAKAQIAEWVKAGNMVPTLHIALPNGHGSDMLFKLLRQQWAQIGVSIQRSNMTDADLWLIDAVTPTDTAGWYLRQFACTPMKICDHFANNKMIEARAAATTQARTDALQAAAASSIENLPFIPLFKPIRWSLVNPSLGGFTPNMRAVHPVDAIRPSRSKR